MIRINFKLIKQPNAWSCTACAFAMACGVSLEKFIEKIGHDGSEIMFPDLSEPMNRKGFPIPECIKVCLNWGLTCTPVDFNPKCGPASRHLFELDHSEFANAMLKKYQGVLSGKGRKNYHCVGWDGSKIYDPNGLVHDFENQYFTPEIFWIIK